jgi:hypothetical protein
MVAKMRILLVMMCALLSAGAAEPPTGGLTGEVHNHANYPANRATVLAKQVDGEDQRITATDETGWFAFHQLADGYYHLTVIYKDSLRMIHETVEVRDGAVTDNLVLAPGLLRLCGTVKQGETPRSSGAMVMVRPVDAGPEDEPLPAVYTDTAGQFCSSNLYAGIHEVTVINAGRFHRRFGLVVPNETSNGLIVQLGGTSLVSGVVTDADGNGVAGALVQAVQADDEAVLVASGRTDIDGRFTFNDLPSGRYQMYAQLHAVSRWQKTETDQNETVRLTLDADGGTIIGTILSSDKGHDHLTSVTIEHLWGVTVPTMIVVDERGGFVVRGLPSGTYRVTAIVAGKKQQRTIDVDHNGKIEIQIDFTETKNPD